jgi:hypothetical protein
MSPFEILKAFLFPQIGAVVALLYITKERKTADTHRRLEIVLMWQIVCGLGLSLLWGGIGHLLFADRVAARTSAVGVKFRLDPHPSG